MQNIKCIFQGGGAKLATLLAAAEALEELEEEGLIKVSEIAGTSAGAIAAFIFAHKRPTSELRAKMKDEAEKIIGEFAKPSTAKIAWAIFRGKPVFKEEKLEKFLRLVINEKPNGRMKLTDTRIPVHIRVSDIKHGEKYTYDGKNSVAAEAALIDSCAIPIAFRNQKSNSQYADGGLLSNLVDNSVFGDTSEKVIAFSFPSDEAHTYSDLVGYLGSIISSSIDNNVSESKEKIISCGGAVCELPSDFSTFDFKRAFSKGLSQRYADETRAIARKLILNAIDEIGRRDRKVELVNRLDGLHSFSTYIMNRLTSANSYAVSKNSIICIGEGLRPRKDNPPKVDILVKDVYIEALGEKIETFKVGISRNELFELGDDIEWEVTDVDGNELKTQHEIINSSQDGDTVWHSCFCLENPLLKGKSPLRVRLRTSHLDLMANLLRGGEVEYMRAASHQLDRISVQDFVLFYPKSLGDVVCVDMVDNLHKLSVLPSKTEEMKANWQSGRRMNEDELAQYRKSLLYSADYAVTGWRCEGVHPGSFSGAVFEKANTIS